LLAGLPQRPTALDPYRHLGAATKRQVWVLERMLTCGRLTPSELAEARRERLELVPLQRSMTAPHFVERVLARLPRGRARRVETSLDAPLQAHIRGILAMHRDRLLAHGAHNVAVAVLDNERGEWLAWEGSGEYFAGSHGSAIDGVVAPRQPGSALKPLTYALAFEKGYTPATVLPDIPSHFPTAVAGVAYAPRNYDGIFRGPMRVRAALAGSENVPAVWMLSQIGVPDLLRLLRRSGLSTFDKNAAFYGLGLTMGDAEVRLDELVAAYAALARGGLAQRPRMLRRIVWADGSATEPARAPVERLVSKRTAFWITDILSDARARAFIFGSGGSLDFPFPVAVKTGTSQAYRDNWTVGYTREVSVGVWVGNFDRSELRSSSGVTGAAPIFHDVLLAAQSRVMGRLPGATDPAIVAMPEGLEPRTLCQLSGLEATPACPSVATERLPRDRRPVACFWHQHREHRTVVAWPARYRAWAAERGLDDHSVSTPRPAGRAATGGPFHERPTLRILNPPEGAVYLRDPTLRDAYQTLPLQATADARARHLTWWVDGCEVGRAAPGTPLDWPLALGTHSIEVSDARGLRAETSIRVR